MLDTYYRSPFSPILSTQEKYTDLLNPNDSKFFMRNNVSTFLTIACMKSMPIVPMYTLPIPLQEMRPN